MRLDETFLLALRNIRGNKMRTFLTMLGIIIGVTAVIVIVGLGNGMSNYVEDSFSELGTNTLTVMVSGRGTSRSVSDEDMYAIVAAHSDLLDRLSPTVSVSGGVKVGADRASGTSVTGVSEDYLAMKGYRLAQGRGLSYMDIVQRSNVCVVGNFLNRTYFAGNAVGESIRIGGKRFTIVGVIEQQADSMEEGGSDDCILLPYTTAARQLGTGTIGSYTITVVSEDKAAQARAAVEDELYQVFGDDSAYAVISMSEMLEMMDNMINVVITVLAVIAAISLVVGGVGIMNIMLVSVTERTREIGIRKAMGAKEGAILQQFVIEAATTSALGGSVGILLGYGLCSVATVLVTHLLGTDLTVTPAIGSVVMAFGISAGLGMLFGYLPARKAALLNPIDALRYD